jgi:hypothetical protein
MADDGDSADGCIEPGAQFYHFVPGLLDRPRLGPCGAGCSFPVIVGRGDRCGFTAVGSHERAESVRADREAAGRRVSWRLRFTGFLRDFADDAVARASRASPTN